MKSTEKNKFMKTFNLSQAQFEGKEKISGSLDLSNLTSIPDGFNPTVGGYLSLRSLTSIPDGFNPTVGVDLYLRSLTSIPDGFNPTVGGSLDLSSLTSIPDGFNPTVGGSIYFSSLTSIQYGFNPTVGGYLDLSNLTSIPDGFNPTVGVDLDLSNLTSIPDGFNPTVGGSLYLSSLTSIPDGFNPTVGGYLDLSNLTSIPDGFNPTVGGDLYLRGLTSIPDGFNPTVGVDLYFNNKVKHIGSNVESLNLMEWQNGKYILVDGIFSEVLIKRGNVFKVKNIGNSKISYVVSDGNGNYSHGTTIKEAKEDLIFKIGNRSKNNYKDLNLDSEMTFEEAIKCYRVITGACQFGIKDFLTRKSISKKAFKISEIIDITQGEYGSSSFAQFFNK